MSSFAVYIAGLDLDGPYEDILYRAGCDDATIVVRDGVMHLDFDRPGQSFSDAVGSVVHAIEQVGGCILNVVANERSW
jgi:hypothetical protein